MQTSLDRIQVRGYKSIRDLDLPLAPLNVLIGANGAGKSNFINLFKLLNSLIEERLQSFVAESGGAEKLLYFGSKTTQTIDIGLTFGANSYMARLAPANPDRLFFRHESWTYQAQGYTRPFEQSHQGHFETNLIQQSQANPGRTVVADYIIRALRGWKIYHFHDTSDSARVKKMGEIHHNEILNPDASNLAAFLYRLQETKPQHYKRIIETIQLVAPFFQDFMLQPLGLSENQILLRWRHKTSDEYFDASMLSDGTLRFMCLTTLLLQPDLPSTILIDEPELGLHPYAISVLAGMLKAAATQTQVIVSTQSVPLVNQFFAEDILVTEYSQGQSTFRRLQTEGIEVWLDEFGIGDIWEKNIIGGRPRP